MRETVSKYIGVRAEGMILAAAIWILVGVGFLQTPSNTPPPPSLWHVLLPYPVSAMVWIITGIIALVLAPSKRWSPIGLSLLIVGPMIRFTSYLFAWIAELFPGPPPGDPNGWFSSLYYASMIAFVVLLSHIPATVRTPSAGRRI